MAEQNNTEMESVAQERERMRSEESRLRRLKRKGKDVSEQKGC